MDIIREIYRLPNYLYSVDVPPYWVILGGQGCKKAQRYNEIDIQILIKKHDDFCNLFSKEILSDEEKKSLAVLAQKINQRSDVRLEKYYTREQQEAFIKQLPPTEKKKIEKQVNMYKLAREYYNDYVYHR